MDTYLLAYRGGRVPEGEAERAQVMDAWGAWMGKVGDNLVDQGAPFGPSKTVTNDGSVQEGGAAALTGYSIIKADSLDAAAEVAKTCPVLSSGGTIDIYETFDVMAAMNAG